LSKQYEHLHLEISFLFYSGVTTPETRGSKLHPGVYVPTPRALVEAEAWLPIFDMQNSGEMEGEQKTQTKENQCSPLFNSVTHFCSVLKLNHSPLIFRRTFLRPTVP